MTSKRTLFVLGLAALAVGAGCKADVTKEVLFVNDSVTHQSVGPIVQAMNFVKSNEDDNGRYAPNFGSSVVGIGLMQVPGFSTQAQIDTYWEEHLASLIEHVDPEVMVVELGYNDCGYNPTAADYEAEIDHFMTQIPSATPVFWLTVHDAYDQLTCDGPINAAITAATATYPNLEIFDFAAFMAGHPEWSSDGVHLSPAGQTAYARFLVEALDSVYLGQALERS